MNEDEVRESILSQHGPKAAAYYDDHFDPDAMFDFAWNNCDPEECSGWDGISTRCSCGNRRVYWCWNGKVLEAEAY